MWSTGIILASAALAAATCDTVADGYRCDPSSSHNWGEYSPYFSVPSTIDNGVPAGCNITFVNLLSRHGSRTPTSDDIESVVDQIQKQTTNYSAEYAFIQNFNYTLGDDGNLTHFGQVEMEKSGIQFFRRYSSLGQTFVPFFRASADPRVVLSAEKFRRGFLSARSESGASAPKHPGEVHIISEDPDTNSTLFAQQLCTLYNKSPIDKINNNAEAIWLNVWSGPVVNRVNANLQGADLSSSQLVYFMELCPFETIGSENGKISQFCGLFNTTEWEYFSYLRTIDKWYLDMQGNPLGPTTGVGYVSELLARMTADRSYVQDNSSYTSVNHTMDDSQASFPLGSAFPLYADFTHDDNIASILAALGLYNATQNLSNTTLTTAEEANGFSTPWVVPLGSRAWFEKMSCSGESEELVRVVINDRVVPLQNCGADDLGRCTLSAFVSNQTFTTDGGQWENCFS